MLASITFGVGVMVASALLTALVRKLAVAHDVLDIPNVRSSHASVTPRGGGSAVVATTSTALLALVAFGAISRDLCLALLGGGIAVAVVGFMDDLFTVRPRGRLAVHLFAAIWAVYWLGGFESLRIGDHLLHLGWAGNALAILGIIWVLNLFNFMDGIDGIATSEALFITCAGALFSLHGNGGVPAVAAVVSCSCAGFLIWNWPPAKIFLGDVGSGYLGYVISVLALAASENGSAQIWVWLILGGAFFVDATVTLLRRLIRGERVHQAHRSHAYQWFARRWGSHRRVTVAVLLIDILWLLPGATFATLYPSFGALATVVALGPLVALAMVAGSGRSEASEKGRS